MILALYILAAVIGLVVAAVLYLAVRIWLLERQSSLHTELLLDNGVKRDRLSEVLGRVQSRVDRLEITR